MIRTIVGTAMATVIAVGLSGCSTSIFDGPGISARETGHGLELSLGPTIFDSNTAELGAEGQDEVTRIARLLRQKPKQPVVIEGYTENEGTEEDNLALSEQRALAVKNALIEEGINADRLHFVGLGETVPTSVQATEDGRPSNRRVEVLFR